MSTGSPTSSPARSPLERTSSRSGRGGGAPWPSTAPSAGSSTTRAPTTARSAARSSARPSRPPRSRPPPTGTATSFRSASTSSPTCTSEAMMATRTQDPTIELPDIPAPEPPGRGGKAMTIGAVCKALKQEFPDISISKIRYLEDQKLLAPRRTPGGYRLYSPGDMARLRTILRLQRDEFLPLRVIRQELASGRGTATGSGRTEGRPLRPASVTVAEQGTPYAR